MRNDCWRTAPGLELGQPVARFKLRCKKIHFGVQSLTQAAAHAVREKAKQTRHLTAVQVKNSIDGWRDPRLGQPVGHFGLATPCSGPLRAANGAPPANREDGTARGGEGAAPPGSGTAKAGAAHTSGRGGGGPAGSKAAPGLGKAEEIRLEPFLILIGLVLEDCLSEVEGSSPKGNLGFLSAGTIRFVEFMAWAWFERSFTCFSRIKSFQTQRSMSKIAPCTIL